MTPDGHEAARQRLRAIGMTAEELQLWEDVAILAAGFLQLTWPGPTQDSEVATAWHGVQSPLLGRMAMRAQGWVESDASSPSDPPDEAFTMRSGLSKQAARANLEAIGLTAREFELWWALGDLGGRLHALPVVHPMERRELAASLHEIGTLLLARPAYRAAGGPG